MKIFATKEVMVLDGPGIIYIDFPIMLKREGSSFGRFSSPVFENFSQGKVYAKLESDSTVQEREIRVSTGNGGSTTTTDGSGGGDTNYPRVTPQQRGDRTNQDLASWASSDVHAVAESVPSAHTVLNIDESYVQKQRPDRTTYIVRFSDDKKNEGGSWADRATLVYT